MPYFKRGEGFESYPPVGSDLSGGHIPEDPEQEARDLRQAVQLAIDEQDFPRAIERAMALADFAGRCYSAFWHGTGRVDMSEETVMEVNDEADQALLALQRAWNRPGVVPAQD